MKIQDLAYQVAERTLELLEKTQHYKVPEEMRKQICAQILDELDDLIKRSK